MMEDPEAWFGKGVALFERGDYRGAVSAFEKATALDPSMSMAWNNRGLALIHLGKYDEAVVSFDKTLSLDPRHPNAAKARAIALERLGDRKGPAAVQAPPAVNAGGMEKIREPLVSAFFSLIFPGWGQWYNGKRWKGIAFFCMFPVLVVLTIMAFLIFRIVPAGALFLIMIPVSLLFGAYDAYSDAGKINNGIIHFTRKSRLFWVPVVLVVVVMVLPFVTFILSVIAAVAFGSAAGSVSHDHVVAATVQQPDERTIILTYQGGSGAGELQNIAVTVTDSNGRAQTKTIGTGGLSGPPVPGDQLTFNGDYFSKDHVVVTGYFSDGSDSVILDNYV